MGESRPGYHDWCPSLAKVNKSALVWDTAGDLSVGWTWARMSLHVTQETGAGIKVTGRIVKCQIRLRAPAMVLTLLFTERLNVNPIAAAANCEKEPLDKDGVEVTQTRKWTELTEDEGGRHGNLLTSSNQIRA
jgi:hypothetical protein